MLFTECGKLPDMIVRFAEDIDLDKAVEMYDEIIDDTEGKAESPKWTKGIYPEREYLCNAIRNRELIIALDGDDIAGGIIFNHKCAPGYEDAPWAVEAAPDEVYTIHTLGVRPGYQHRGIASLLSEAVIEEAGKRGAKAVRLDVIEGNTPSILLYEKLGFINHGKHPLQYDSVSVTEFTLMEKVL